MWAVHANQLRSVRALDRRVAGKTTSIAVRNVYLTIMLLSVPLLPRSSPAASLDLSALCLPQASHMYSLVPLSFDPLFKTNPLPTIVKFSMFHNLTSGPYG